MHVVTLFDLFLYLSFLYYPRFVDFFLFSVSTILILQLIFNNGYSWALSKIFADFVRRDESNMVKSNKETEKARDLSSTASLFN